MQEQFQADISLELLRLSAGRVGRVVFMAIAIKTIMFLLCIRLVAILFVSREISDTSQHHHHCYMLHVFFLAQMS